MDNKLFETVDQYIGDLFNDKDSTLEATERSIKEFNIPSISVSPNQGKFLQLLAKLCHAKKILEIWKDWDNGNLSTHKDHFADTIDLHFADGTILHGARDSVMTAVQAFRDTYKSVTSQVHAVTPLKSNDKDEDWVCVWGKEIHTDSKGVTDSVELMETWRLNKNGKTDLVYQYNAKSAPMPAKK